MQSGCLSKNDSRCLATILWGGMALAAVGGIVALYSPEIITWLRKITSPRIKTAASVIILLAQAIRAISMLWWIVIVGVVLNWVVYLPDTLDQLRRWPAMFEQVPVEWVHIIGSGLALISAIITILWGTGVAMNWLWRRIHSTGKAHKVSAGPVRFHFSVPESAVTLRRAPLWTSQRVLNEMKAWGKAGEG